MTISFWWTVPQGTKFRIPGLKISANSDFCRFHCLAGWGWGNSSRFGPTRRCPCTCAQRAAERIHCSVTVCATRRTYEACPNEDEHERLRVAFLGTSTCQSAQSTLGSVWAISCHQDCLLTCQTCQYQSVKLCCQSHSAKCAQQIGSMKLCCTQQHHIIACATRGKTQDQTFRLLQEVYGDNSLSRLTCRRWYIHARQGVTSCADLD